MWPDPRDLVMTGAKLYLHTIIAQSAQALGQSLPSIAVCPNPTVKLVQDILDGKIDGVLKREYSSDTKHVFSRHTKNAVKNFQSAIERERKCWRWNAKGVCETPKWFIQPYIPSLVYLGELRAFIVNGIIINIVSTTPVNGLLDTYQAGLLRPLCKIRYGHPFFLVCPTKTVYLRLTEEDIKSRNRTWLIAPEQSMLEIDQENCFEKYALEMLGMLVAKDEIQIGRRSQLRIFVRLDAAVFKVGHTGKFRYALSEITPCHHTALFTAWDSAGLMDYFFQEMAKTLHFIASERKRSRLT
jgi:hypothetical protein